VIAPWGYSGWQECWLRKGSLWWCWKQSWCFHCIIMNYIILLGTWFTFGLLSCLWSWPKSQLLCFIWLWFSVLTSHRQRVGFFSGHLMLDTERYSGT